MDAHEIKTQHYDLPALWTAEQLYFDGDEYFQGIIEDINNAQTRITMEMYIFEEDAVGKKVFAALKAAANRGVEVRLLLDAIGSHRFIQDLLSRGYPEHMKVKVFHPHPWTYPYENSPGIFHAIWLFGKRLAGINNRNHRKIITIDGKITWAGSFNITEDHSRQHRQGEAWIDIGIRLVGWISPLLAYAFAKLWNPLTSFRAKKFLPSHRAVSFTHPHLRLNQTYMLRRRSYKSLLKRFSKAQHRIWLRTGYFIPKRRIIKLLAKAAKRGVDVRILLSSKSDVFYFKWLQMLYWPYLVKAGVKVYLHEPTVIHAKNSFIDDWVTVGSSNMNHRSLMHDLEIDFVLQDSSNKILVEKNFLEILQASKHVTRQQIKQWPWWRRLGVRLLFFFRYWN